VTNKIAQTTLRSPISYVAACSKVMTKIIMQSTKCMHQSRNSFARMSEDLNHAVTSYQPPELRHKTTTYLYAGLGMSTGWTWYG